jgi:hypothetical protein
MKTRQQIIQNFIFCTRCSRGAGVRPNCDSPTSKGAQVGHAQIEVRPRRSSKNRNGGRLYHRAPLKVSDPYITKFGKIATPNTTPKSRDFRGGVGATSAEFRVNWGCWWVGPSATAFCSKARGPRHRSFRASGLVLKIVIKKPTRRGGRTRGSPGRLGCCIRGSARSARRQRLSSRNLDDEWFFNDTL